MRTFDLAALRSFLAVAETGSVTRAAAMVNLTQSAVSMQLRRLEDALGVALLDRRGRPVSLTAEGEQLVGYARRMLALNDEAWARLTDKAFEGEIVLGVPHDIVYPAVPGALHAFATGYPRVKVNLVSSHTQRLKAMFAAGDVDLILTTEVGDDPGAERLTRLPLVWVGAPGGGACRTRPLRLAFEYQTLFRRPVIEALERAGMPWEMAVESEATQTIEVSVAADLAVHVWLKGTHPPHLEPIPPGSELPELPAFNVNLYRTEAMRHGVGDALSKLLRTGFAAL